MLKIPESIAQLASAAVGGLGGGLPEPLPPEPFSLLDQWLEQAVRDRHVPNPNAMVLATVAGAGAEARPSARVVLCKQLEVRTGSLVFFTNYQSRKGEELAAIPRAACVFHWDHRERQARIEGSVQRISERESDEYFVTRPLLSRLGAWSSQQSRPLERRADLIRKLEATLERFGIAWSEVVAGRTDRPIPRPPHWGGFRLVADRVELWQGVAGRLHDRGVWMRSTPGDSWSAGRLQP